MHRIPQDFLHRDRIITDCFLNPQRFDGDMFESSTTTSEHDGTTRTCMSTVERLPLRSSNLQSCNGQSLPLFSSLSLLSCVPVSSHLFSCVCVSCLSLSASCQLFNYDDNDRSSSWLSLHTALTFPEGHNARTLAHSLLGEHVHFKPRATGNKVSLHLC